ncbi:hypothetical protein D3C73_729070 [compost metagenome]
MGAQVAQGELAAMTLDHVPADGEPQPHAVVLVAVKRLLQLRLWQPQTGTVVADLQDQ